MKICNNTRRQRKLKRSVTSNKTRTFGNTVPCPECGKTYKTQLSMRTHMRKCHPIGDAWVVGDKLKQFNCILCKHLQYTSNDRITEKHVKANHGFKSEASEHPMSHYWDNLGLTMMELNKLANISRTYTYRFSTGDEELSEAYFGLCKKADERRAKNRAVRIGLGMPVDFTGRGSSGKKLLRKRKKKAGPAKKPRKKKQPSKMKFKLKKQPKQPNSTRSVIKPEPEPVSDFYQQEPGLLKEHFLVDPIPYPPFHPSDRIATRASRLKLKSEKVKVENMVPEILLPKKSITTTVNLYETPPPFVGTIPDFFANPMRALKTEKREEFLKTPDFDQELLCADPLEGVPFGDFEFESKQNSV